MARKKHEDDNDELNMLEWRVGQLKDIMSLEYRKLSYEIDEETGERWMAPDLVELLAMTMQFVLTMRGAPKDCRNPACRLSGCHLRIEKNGDGVCPGGMTPQDIDKAALMLAYLIHFTRRYAPWAFEGLSRK